MGSQQPIETFYTYPDRIIGLQLENDGKIAKLTWKTPEVPPTYYVIEWWHITDVLNRHKIETTSPIYTFANINSTIEVRVAAVNVDITGEYSNTVTIHAGPKSPCNLIVRYCAQDKKTLIIQYKDPDPTPKLYKVSVKSVLYAIWKSTETPDWSSNIPDLIPGHSYEIMVSAIANEIESIPCRHPHFVQIAPPEVKDLSCKNLTRNIFGIDWKPAYSAISYHVKWKNIIDDDHHFREKEENGIVLNNLTLGMTYILSVAARNSAGCGPYSTLEFSTGQSLSIPSNLKVEHNDENPESCLNVMFDEPENKTNAYTVVATDTWSNEKSNQIVSTARCKMENLKPGTQYIVSVFSGKDLISEEEIVESDPILTYPAEVANVNSHIEVNNKYKMHWVKVISADMYMIEVTRCGFESCSLQTSECSIIVDTSLSSKYEVRVRAKNSAGVGKYSLVHTFMTVPEIPKNLRYVMKETNETEIKCDAVKEAKEYIFKITTDNKKEEMKFVHKPHLMIKGLYVNFKISVCAKNDGGESGTTTTTFRQGLGYLKKTTLKKAADTFLIDQFIPVETAEKSSESVTKVSTKFNIQQITRSIKHGQTFLVYGVPLSGKTAVCKSALQTLDEDILGLYMDFNEIKHISEKMDMKDILHSFMKELSDDEMKLLIVWMKQNSGKIMIAIDNFTFHVNQQLSNKKFCGYEDKISPNELFQYFLIDNRQIFPHCQTIVTTMQSELHARTKPFKYLTLLGFDEEGIQKKIQTVLKKNPDSKFLTPTKTFLTNPGFCEIILQLIKDNQNKEFCFDKFSTGFVFNEVMSKYLNRHLKDQDDKLKMIMSDAEQKKPKQLLYKVKPLTKSQKNKKRKEKKDESTIYEASAEPDEKIKNCMELYHMCLTAIHMTFYLKDDEFKAHFSENSMDMANNTFTMLLVAGLLRLATSKHTSSVLISKLTQNSSSNLTKTKTVVENFIKAHAGIIKEYIYENSKITLDWILCCIELGNTKLLSDCCPDIKIKNELSNNQIDQICRFLQNVPLEAKINIDVKNTLDAGYRLQIDTARSSNVYGKALDVKTYKTTSILGNRKRSKSDAISLRSTTLSWTPFSRKDLESIGGQSDIRQHCRSSTESSDDTVKEISFTNSGDAKYLGQSDVKQRSRSYTGTSLTVSVDEKNSGKDVVIEDNDNTTTQSREETGTEVKFDAKAPESLLGTSRK
ncbi:uncharacterized protein LOC120334973 isoform X2 [Styela clava]